MGFADSIKAFQEKALLAANTSVCKVVDELFVTTVVNTPTSPEAKWSKGLSINSWYSGVNSFDTTIGTSLDYSGTGSLSRIKATLSQKPFYGEDGFVTLTNSVPYIWRVEQLGWLEVPNETGWNWTKTMGGYHMVSNSVAYIKGKYM